MTIREDVTTREAARAPALVTMPAFRTMPALADLRRHPVLGSLPERAAASATHLGCAARDLQERFRDLQERFRDLQGRFRDLQGRFRTRMRAWIDGLPTMQAIGRKARRETLLFLRDNGFAPLAGLFALSPRLAWAMVLPFAMTSLFGIFIFGIELVLVSALGLFFAFLVANDAARRLQEEAKADEGENSAAPLVVTIPGALPAPAEAPLTPPLAASLHARQPVSTRHEEA